MSKNWKKINSKIAIDVALLPDRTMTEQAVAISQRQAETGGDKILLDPKTCLPHISLAMGVIDSDDIEPISDKLKEIAAGFTCLDLSADRYNQYTSPKGNILSEFTVARTEELYRLHTAVVTGMKDYLESEATVDMLYSPPPVEDITLGWIKSYLKNSSLENFKPHITLGFGQIENVNTPIAFNSNTLALCHLGNYCTCRKILHKIQF